MRTLVWISVLGLGLATPALAQRDSVVQSDTTLTVIENPPGLLALAKFKAIDARNIALAKYPDAKVVKAEITRRKDEIVYVFRLERTGHRTRDVLVSAETGQIVNIIPKAKPDTARKP